MERNSSLYQIFLRPFTPEGTLKGAEKMLPHIASLGFDIVYLCPMFDADDDENTEGWSPRHMKSGIKNPKNPYRIKDYFKVDEEYGNDDDLHSFIDTAHRLGLKVVLDLVYFHCGPNAVFLEEHPDFIKRDEDGKPLVGHWRFPMIDDANPQLREYLYGNMEYYITEFGVDGYRCDIADHIPLDFWRGGVQRVRQIKPDAIFINEGKDPSFLEDVFDANYFVMWGRNLGKVFKQMLSVREFLDIVKPEYEALPARGIPLLYFDTHDMVNNSYDRRVERVAGHDLTEAAIVMNFTCAGIPFFYNGNEICDDARHTLWSNRFYCPEYVINWSHALTPAAKCRMDVVKQLNTLKHHDPVLADGSLRWLGVSDEEHVFAFARELGDESIIVLINASDAVMTATVDASLQEGAKVLMQHNLVISERSDKTTFTANPGGYVIIKQ